MSSFKTKAKHKLTGEIHEIWCLDDYFGRHQYGYQAAIEDDTVVMTDRQFDEQYEEVI